LAYCWNWRSSNDFATPRLQLVTETWNNEMKVSWTKDQLKDTRGFPLTQSLFLEINYSPEYSLFTLNDEDKEYEGKTYPALRRYYLEIGDPTEYKFAKTCLLGWDHWQRILENKVLRKEIDKWREELEVSLRSEGIQAIVDATVSDGGNFQAARWLADKGWDKKGAGRPSRAEQEREKRIKGRLDDVFDSTIVRMEDYK
jgi:hypothetical protein